MVTDCTIYRCSRQPEMYLYLRAGMDPEALPDALRQLTGRLAKVMELELDAQRPLARVDVDKVIEALRSAGYFLQMPPKVAGHLHFGD